VRTGFRLDRVRLHAPPILPSGDLGCVDVARTSDDLLTLDGVVFADPMGPASLMEMAVRHIVLLKWKAEATAEERERVVTELRRLPGIIPELRHYRVEPNGGPDPTNFDLAIEADLDDMASYEIYRDHPDHQAVIREFIRPILEGRAAVQITV
jgi:DNA-binding Lrp family transcriptional regulator